MSARHLFAFFCLLPALNWADESINYRRLGWATRDFIAELPKEERPEINKACHGAWLTPISKKTPAADLTESPIEALAAWVYYNPEGSSRLNGNVKISQQGRLILADNAELAHDKSSGQFSGNILLAEAGTVITGEKARLNLSNQEAFIEQSEFVSTFLNAHGKAKQIQRNDDGVVTSSLPLIKKRDTERARTPNLIRMARYAGEGA